MRRLAALVVTAGLAGAAACASTPATVVSTAPRFPSYPLPGVPPGLAASADVRAQHDAAWARLQSGDTDGAARAFDAILAAAPGFYPAAAGRGFADLAGRNYDRAAAAFQRAIDADDTYLPAWQGLATTRLEQGRDADARRPLERIVELDPSRAAELGSRIELLRFREVQALLESAGRARQDGRLAEAATALGRALVLSPTSSVILRELAAVELARGEHDAALAHARRAVELDGADAEAHATLGAVFEGRGELDAAADAYGRAAAIDDRGGWARRSADLASRARLASLPAEMRSLSGAASVTRAQTATIIALRLEALIAAAPRRVTAVATDVRNHWAASWILPVTQAGVMEIFPNHTFQPSVTLRRSDLARIGNELLALASTGRPADLARWRANQARFADLPATHVVYRAAAASVAAGVMAAEDGRFLPTAPVTGAELLAAVARIAVIADR